MKRIIAFVLAISMALSLCGCSGQVPNGFTKESYKLCKEALEIMDDYMAGKMELEDAEKQLSEIYDELEVMGDDAQTRFDKALAEGSEDADECMSATMALGGALFYISYFVLAMYDYNNGYTTYDYQSGRDGLADAMKFE